MEEALDAIMRLLRCEEPVTMKTDWFEMREARLHLAPYTDPHFQIAVASTITPVRHDRGRARTASACCRSAPACRAGRRRWPAQWKIAEDTAAKHGKTMDRKDWRIVVNVHIAEDDEQALRQVKAGERHRDARPISRTRSAARPAAPTIRCATASRRAPRWSARRRP